MAVDGIIHHLDGIVHHSGGKKATTWPKNVLIFTMKSWKLAFFAQI
jgi:hypothetical protein